MSKVDSKIRLAKYLAQAGIAARRKAELLILAGRVSVNGQVEKNVATNIDPKVDEIKFDGHKLQTENKVYYVLHKPVGYVCSLEDAHNKNKVTDLLPAEEKIWPVGRLDKDSSGLLILTNDGELTNLMTHPRYAKPKKYQVIVNKKFVVHDAKLLESGIELEEGLARVDKIKIISDNNIEITLHQGWKRQIRRMLSAVGYRVISLVRVQEGKLILGDLLLGQYKKINRDDIL